jgi:hypothetical protein
MIEKLTPRGFRSLCARMMWNSTRITHSREHGASIFNSLEWSRMALGDVKGFLDELPRARKQHKVDELLAKYKLRERKTVRSAVADAVHAHAGGIS